MHFMRVLIQSTALVIKEVIAPFAILETRKNGLVELTFAKTSGIVTEDVNVRRSQKSLRKLIRPSFPLLSKLASVTLLQ